MEFLTNASSVTNPLPRELGSSKSGALAPCAGRPSANAAGACCPAVVAAASTALVAMVAVSTKDRREETVVVAAAAVVVVVCCLWFCGIDNPEERPAFAARRRPAIVIRCCMVGWFIYLFVCLVLVLFVGEMLVCECLAYQAMFYALW